MFSNGVLLRDFPKRNAWIFIPNPGDKGGRWGGGKKPGQREQVKVSRKPPKAKKTIAPEHTTSRQGQRPDRQTGYPFEGNSIWSGGGSRISRNENPPFSNGSHFYRKALGTVVKT